MGATMPVTAKERRGKVKSQTRRNRRAGRHDQTRPPSRSSQLAAIHPNHQVRQIQPAYQARIRELRADGATDGVRLNAASEKDFWHFVNSPPAAGKGSLVLLDNGNLRALWKGEATGQLGVQFLGGGMAEYVIFRRRPEAEKVSQAAGLDTLDGVKRLIDAFDLSQLAGQR